MDRKPTSFHSGYSPPIDITLELSDQRLAVAEVGPDYLVVQSRLPVPPTQALLIITVDGQPVKRTISLPEGIDPSIDRQPFVLLETHLPLTQAAQSR